MFIYLGYKIIVHITEATFISIVYSCKYVYRYIEY